MGGMTHPQTKLADLILIHAVYRGTINNVSDELRDDADYLDCQNAADAIRAAGFVSPSAEQIEASARAMYEHARLDYATSTAPPWETLVEDEKRYPRTGGAQARHWRELARAALTA